MNRHGYYLSSISIEELAELGFEIGDDREDEENVAKIQSKYLLSLLTRRQKRVALLLDDGYSRKEVALKLEICVQAVHQIVIRIRKRLKGQVGGRDLQDNSRELILILSLTYPGLKSESIYRWWYHHPALKDYPRPNIKKIRRYIDEIYTDDSDEDGPIEELGKESENHHSGKIPVIEAKNSGSRDL